MDESKVRSEMAKVIELVTSEVGSMRTGRASGSVVSDLTVSVYGGAQMLQINELANVTTPDAETIVIEPWDKSIIGEIKKGIEAANVGLNPVLDAEIIRVSLPPMTSEDREKYVKLLSTKLENGKVMIRQVRGEELKKIRRSFDEKELSEDEKFAQEKQLQKVTDEFVGKIEDIGERKKKELLQV